MWTFFYLKIRKTECDIEFLKVCQENNLTPKFVNFKLYKKNIRSTCHFRQFQNKLIYNELSEKEKNLKKLRSENKNLVNKLRNSISYLDANHLFAFINNINDKKITKVKNVHNKKLLTLKTLFSTIQRKFYQKRKLKLLVMDSNSAFLLKLLTIHDGSLYLKSSSWNWKIAIFLLKLMMTSTFSKPASKLLPTKRTILSALIVIPYNKASSTFWKPSKQTQTSSSLKLTKVMP